MRTFACHTLGSLPGIAHRGFWIQGRNRHVLKLIHGFWEHGKISDSSDVLSEVSLSVISTYLIEVKLALGLRADFLVRWCCYCGIFFGFLLWVLVAVLICDALRKLLSLFLWVLTRLLFGRLFALFRIWGLLFWTIVNKVDILGDITQLGAFSGQRVDLNRVWLDPSKLCFWWNELLTLDMLSFVRLVGCFCLLIELGSLLSLSFVAWLLIHQRQA